METEAVPNISPAKITASLVDSLVQQFVGFETICTDLLAQRRKMLRAILGKSNRSPFLWGVGSQNGSVDFVDAVQWMHGKVWQSRDLPAPPQGSIQLFGSRLREDLAAIALAAYGGDASFYDGVDADETDLLSRPVESQLRCVELPLWKKLIAESDDDEPASFLLHSMEEIVKHCLDADGWPESRIIADAAVLAASWCRCCDMFKFAGLQMDPDAYFMLCELNQQLVRLSRDDGSLLLGEYSGGLNCNSFKKALSRNFSTSFLSQLKRRKKASRRTREPATCSISEWGQVGVLQSKWKLGGNKVAVAFGDQRLKMDVSNGASLVCGDCTPEISINGVPQSIESEIGVSGFLRFDKCDYLELEMEFEAAVVQRQLLFFAKDKLLFLNDVVTTKEASQIEYRNTLGLGSGFELLRETENNEFYLKNGDVYSLVLPLSMPEWKTERSDTSVEFNVESFAVSRQADGLGFSTPIVFDLNPKRSQKPRTWRRLTVAENMQTVGDDAAAAYRVQIGRDQWLFYRSVSERGNRTFMGQNYADEFFVGSIDCDGNVVPLVEIE